MTIKEMELFLSVCKYGSITTTAEKEYMTAQGVSNIIKRIEEELQVELFIRNPRGVKLTDYGEYFQEKTKKLVNDYHDTTKELLSMKAQKKGYIQLASAFGVIRHLSPEFILEFQKAYPHIQMDYIELPDLLVESYVSEKKADIGFTPNPDVELFDCIPLFSSKLYFIAHSNSQLYDKESVSIEDVAGEPLVIESGNFQINRLFK